MQHHQEARQSLPFTSSCFQVTEVFCDFDGTITRVDATDAIMENFALPAWKEWEQRWVDGEISSRHCLSRQVELIQADRNTLKKFVTELPIDEGILELDRRCTEHQVPLIIVSDGLDLVVETILRRHGLLHLPAFSNHLRWDEDGRPSLSSFFTDQECESGAGTCKCGLIRSSTCPSSQSVYIGDGRSDQCVSRKMQTVFAKGQLREWCEINHISVTPFETLTEVVERLFPQEGRPT